MQLVVFIVIALGAAGAAEALVLAQPAAFVRYFGIFPPLAVFGVASAAGALAVVFAQLTVYKPGVALAQRARLAGAALLLVLPIVAFDAVVRLPEGVAFPASLLFYPAMGFVAEVLFHLVPLALLHRVPFRLAAPAIVLIEPLYQLTALTGATLPLWRSCTSGSR